MDVLMKCSSNDKRAATLIDFCVSNNNFIQIKFTDVN